MDRHECSCHPSCRVVTRVRPVTRRDAVARLARIDALLLLMALIWGTNYAIVKHAFARSIRRRSTPCG